MKVQNNQRKLIQKLLFEIVFDIAVMRLPCNLYCYWFHDRMCGIRALEFPAQNIALSTSCDVCQSSFTLTYK